MQFRQQEEEGAAAEYLDAPCLRQERLEIAALRQEKLEVACRRAVRAGIDGQQVSLEERIWRYTQWACPSTIRSAESGWNFS